MEIDCPLFSQGNTHRAPPEIADGDLQSFWRYAVGKWRSERVPHVRSLPVERC